MEDIPAIPTILANEAVGDWSGLKGNHYHLLVATFLVLSTGEDVTFYAGNDLHTVLTSSPVPQLDGTVAVAGRYRDQWIQVKNEQNAWTLAHLLSDDTLLLTLILNALWSESQDRSWEARLFASSEIRATEISAFANQRTEDGASWLGYRKEHIGPCRSYFRILRSACSRWNAWAKAHGAERTTAAYVDRLAIAILGQIAKGPHEPVTQLTLRIDLELQLQYSDPVTLGTIRSALIGALSSVGATTTAVATRFGMAWLEQVTGYDLSSHNLIPKFVVEACRRQVERRANWNPTTYVARKAVKDSFTDFLRSDRPLFVLTGDSGTGKSSELSSIATALLDGRIRLLLPGAAITSERTLVNIIFDEVSDMARAAISPEELYHQFRSSAVDVARGPFVLLADDIPKAGDTLQASNLLVEHCVEAVKRGIKLVVSAETSTWARLATDQVLQYVFRRTELTDHTVSTSFELGGLDSAEIVDFLALRMPAGCDAGRLSLPLRTPAFASLRNPYLLSLFIDQHSDAIEAGQIQPVFVDSLLDADAEKRFRQTVREIGLEPDECESLVHALTSKLWHSRRGGSHTSAIVDALEPICRGQERLVIRSLQAGGVLTRSESAGGRTGLLSYANPQFGDRLTARWLAENMREGQDVLPNLEPGLDDGVLTALVRQPVDGVVDDPIQFAAQIVQSNPDWLEAVTKGLSQRIGADWRVLAIIAACSSLDRPYALWNCMRAIGEMASHSGYARKWIRATYLDGSPAVAFAGELALGAAMPIDPDWVGQLVRSRLERELARPSGFSSFDDNIRQASLLRRAIEPLRHVSNKESALAAMSVVDWLLGAYTRPYLGRDPRVGESIDESLSAIKGQAAVYGNPDDIERILAGLASKDVATRLAAAQALLPVAHDVPNIVRDAIILQAGVEDRVVNAIGRLLYFYCETEGRSVVEAIRSSAMLGTNATSIGLLLLARSARTNAHDVGTVLPRNLESIPEWARAILSEMLAFAWWQFGANLPESAARSVMESLISPAYEGLDTKFQLFAANGASTAMFGIIGLDTPNMSASAFDAPVAYHWDAEEVGQNFLYIDFSQVCKQFADVISNHALFGNWCLMLCETARLYCEHKVHPIEKQLCQWQYRVTVLVTDYLCIFARFIEQPDGLVKLLPGDWPMLRFCTALLRADRLSYESKIIACELCKNNISVSGQISDARDEFIAELNSLGQLPEEYRGPLLQERVWWAEPSLHELRAAVHNEPDSVLDVLHQSVNETNAVPFLLAWSGESADWRSTLLGRGYRDQFSLSPMTVNDCTDTCEQMIAAAYGLTPTPRGFEYSAVYGTLADFSRGPANHIPHLTVTQDDFLQQSHLAALSIVSEATNTYGPLNPTWLQETICTHASWVFDRRHIVTDNHVSTSLSESASTIYFPPAFRIALTIACHRAFGRDVVFEWLSEQHDVSMFLQSDPLKVYINGHYKHMDSGRRIEVLEDVKAMVASKLSLIPLNVHLMAISASIHLLLGRTVEAFTILRECVTVPWYDKRVLAGVHYDLACCYARENDWDNCRRELEVAIPDLQHCPRKHLESD